MEPPPLASWAISLRLTSVLADLKKIEEYVKTDSIILSVVEFDAGVLEWYRNKIYLVRTIYFGPVLK